MAQNPNFQGMNGKTVNLTGGSSVNAQNSQFGTSHHNFNFNRKLAFTARFGDITPFECYHAVAGDTVPFGSVHELRSFSLQSPLLSKFRQIKTYFQVPMSAILPRTWDYIFTNPVSGNDVPNDALCIIQPYDVKALIYNLGDVFNSPDCSTVVRARALFMIESILSYGSVTSYLGCPMSSGWYFSFDGKTYSVDDFFENVVFSAMNDGTLSIERFHEFVDKLRYGGTLERAITTPDFVDVLERAHIFATSEESGYTDIHVFPPFNYDSLLAYQLGCAEYFSNEFIDAVYNAQLYRDNAQAFVQRIYDFGSYAWPSFQLNGILIQYDAFSGRILSDVIQTLSNFYENDENLTYALNYLQLIFCYRSSLRATDYFTSVKNRPLAVGNVTSPVVSGGVSAIDITRNIQAQRFLNAVNKVGRKFSSYLKGIMGTQASPDRHEPHFLAESSNYISGFEVEQTTNPQAPTSTDQLGAQVTLLKNEGGQFEYECFCDSPCIIIGVVHYDIERLYSDSMYRFFIHANRYDFFNPFMQYTGDQDLKQFERFYGGIFGDDPFGYQVKYGEYKESFDRAVGGFCTDALPSWVFIDRVGDSFSEDGGIHIDSDNIRNNNYEMDRFFKVLPYAGLAKNFHFILISKNNCTPNRPMEFKSNIL